MKLMRDPKRKALAAVLAAGAAFGATAARAADDNSTVTSVLGILGVDMNNSGEKIDYRERPKLVVPPNPQALPEPQSGAARPASWPVDQDNTYRHGARVAKSSGGAGPDEPSRATLTQPPEGYRRPTQDLSKITDADAKPSWWQNPFGSISKAVGFGQ